MGRPAKYNGYTEYRYGSKKKKPVTLAQVFKGEKRKHVIHEVIETLKDWRFDLAPV